MAKRLDEILKFAQVTPVLQAASLLNLTCVSLGTYLTVKGYYQNPPLFVSSLVFVLSNIAFLPGNHKIALAKMEEYKQVKNALEEKGWDERLIETKSHSWCQRHLTKVASNDTGFGEETRKYLNEKGYSRYNFFK